MRIEMDTKMKTATLWVIGGALAGGMGATAPAVALADATMPAALLQESEEDEAYRSAREAVARGQFDRAVDLFAQMQEAFPDSRYAADTYYWQAFAMYRMEALRDALAVLEAQLEEYPTARISEDARDLELRLRSLLGQRGDAQAAERALREAEMALATQQYMQQAGINRAMMAAEQAIARSQMVAGQSTEAAMLAMEMAAMRAGSMDQEGCEGDEVRQAALQALMQMETERALPLLRGVLESREECSVSLRKQAIFVLGQLDDDGVEELIIDVARNDPDPGVQEAAVFWLSQVGSESAVAALSDILAATDNPVLQENAIFALSQHMGGEAGELLKSYALDPSKPDHVREKAIFWLSQQPDYADAAFLMELYEDLDSPGLKDHVFYTLFQLDDPQAVDWVLARALDPEEDVELRKQALFWAGQHETVELQRLEGLYGQLSDGSMKEQLIFLYAQRDEPARVDRLIEIIESEEDPELRKRAIFWLGQTGDERAIEFLLKLVDDPR
ncbi:MAG: HEAT repeat domain-containing protein [Gemmatimonadota bacterium]|nr:HEAT repeat domain-containing protein [Gemmatimonadota bacterium]